ncbi:YbaB/EbfC family nucleoid-associated protein [Rhodovibrionaceae bacterium A322]
MKNLGQMMKQAQQMQAKMEEMQQQLTELEVTGQSGAGMVQVTMTGKSEVKSLKIDPSLVDPSDVEVLEDLIVAAINDARSKSEEASQQAMQDITGGLNLPAGFKMPF